MEFIGVAVGRLATTEEEGWTGDWNTLTELTAQ
jgi:hypothetical protein